MRAGLTTAGVMDDLGRVAIVQSDSRFCDPEAATATGVRTLPYWWRSVMLNAQWAHRQGYSHLTYCIKACAAASTASTQTSVAALAAAWCKIPAISDALQTRQYKTVLYLDSDAFWNRTDSGLQALGRYMWPGDWSSAADGGGSFFFGCNLPWAGEDRGRRQWNWTAENAARGPPNTGVMLIRRNAASLATLTEWWRAPFVMPRWNQRHQWEQSVLWQLWHTQPGFATPLRVLSDPADGKCMRTMDRKQPSVVAHIPGGGVRGPLAVQRREDHFRTANLKGVATGAAWSTEVAWLSDAAAGTDAAPLQVPIPSARMRKRCTQRLIVGAGATSVPRLKPCVQIRD